MRSGAALRFSQETEATGPSLERHLLDGSFREAAELCEAGDEIPLAILPPGLGAAQLAAFLRERGFLFTRAGGDSWLVSDEHPEITTTRFGLQMTVHVAWPVLFIAFLALASSACTERLEAPAGARRVEASATVKAITEIYLGRQARPDELVTVYAVPADCDAGLGQGPVGFMHEGGCRGGMTDVPYATVYIADVGDLARYLPHEVMHALGADHPVGHDWEFDPLDPTAKQIFKAQWFLGEHPALLPMNYR